MSRGIRARIAALESQGSDRPRGPYGETTCRACGSQSWRTLPPGRLTPAESEAGLLELLGPETMATWPRCTTCGRRASTRR